MAIDAKLPIHCRRLAASGFYETMAVTAPLKVGNSSRSSANHLRLVLKEAKPIVDNALGRSPDAGQP